MVFTWTVGSGVTQYELNVGTTLGGHDLVWGPTQTGTSQTVNNLAGLGTVFVRIWSKVAGVWQFNDYQYQTASAPATMSSPTPGTTLPGSTVTFIWTNGLGVSQYELDIGTGLGGHDLVWGPTQGGTSQTVNNLFSNGTIYVRLWSNVAGTWQYNDYQYQPSAPPTPATMTGPTPGATISGSSTTFVWTTGYGASQYELNVGTSLGGHDLAWGPDGTQTSQTVNNLPAGTIYVRLWSDTAGTWV